MNGEYAFVREADVVVCGAGTAGSTAAIAAADEGLSVIVVEQFGGAGGSGSMSLVTPLMSTRVKGNPDCSYVAGELNRRMAEGGWEIDGTWFDPLALGIVLEEMLVERGVKLMFHATVTGVLFGEGGVRGVEVHNKSGNGLVRGKLYVDATGDCDVCALAGLPTLHGDEATGANQPVSLRYIIGGVDVDKYWKFCRSFEKAENADLPAPKMFSNAMVLSTAERWIMAPVFMKALEAGDITTDDACYWQFFTVPGRADCIAFNCPEFFDIPDATDADALTHVQLEGKKAIVRQLRFYHKYFPGFENAYISSISPMVGVRESRRGVGDYIVTSDDVYAYRKFPDAICQTNYSIDVHKRDLNCHTIEERDPNEPPYYEVPLRSLIAKDADNLMFCGRNVSAEFIAQSSIRIIPTCRALGEACGIAAAMALASGDLHAVDGARVRARMIEKGAKFA